MGDNDSPLTCSCNHYRDKDGNPQRYPDPNCPVHCGG